MLGLHVGGAVCVKRLEACCGRVCVPLLSQWFRTAVGQQGASVAMDAAVIEHLFTRKMPSLALDHAGIATFDCVKTYFLFVNESSGGVNRLSTAEDDIETLIAPDRLLVRNVDGMNAFVCALRRWARVLRLDCTAPHSLPATSP